ncbi:helix-turn-helix domain-containing protein [Glaciimonas sp. GNP009]
MTARIKTLAAILRLHPGTSSESQRIRLLTALQQLGSVTTDEARRYLDSYCPPARVMELRAAGHRITTVMESLETECGALHTAGRYVLHSKSLQVPT